MPEYHDTIEVIENFLQQKPCAPEIPLMTDGNKLVSYGVMVARWENGKLCLMTDRVEKQVVLGVGFARAIRRVWRNVGAMAKVRGLI